MAVDEAVENKSRRRRNRAEEEVEEVELDAEGERALTTSKGRITPGRRNKQTEEGGGNFVVRTFRSIREYLQGVQDELDKVVWPTREELVRLTRIVMMVTIASAIGLGTISIGFTQLFRAGLENPLVFVVFGIAVVGAYIVIRQWFKRNQQQSEIAPF